jgi:GLPGLI family protein
MLSFKTYITVLMAAAICHVSAFAQTRFHAQVEVEYEKTLNVRASSKEASPEWYEEIKDRLPQTAVTYHVFKGDTAHSIYMPGREVPLDPKYWYRPVADKNVVFTDYRHHSTIAQKPIFEETFLVQDSLTKIKWKLTADTRTIAGYECRKAIGILDDTVAVFAFYTDEILIPGGPESIQGLPGLILGMGIPRLHTTWFATKVMVNGTDMKEVQAPKKGKKTTRGEMLKQLSDIMRQWGTWGSRMIVHYTV